MAAASLNPRCSCYFVNDGGMPLLGVALPLTGALFMTFGRPGLAVKAGIGFHAKVALALTVDHWHLLPSAIAS
jgi:hypothetical protein